MTEDKFERPPQEVIDKLTRPSKPLVADLQGPGPFLFPLLTRCVGLSHLGNGEIELQLETASGQEVRFRLTEQAANSARTLIEANEMRQEIGAKGHEN